VKTAVRSPCPLFVVTVKVCGCPSHDGGAAGVVVAVGVVVVVAAGVVVGWAAISLAGSLPVSDAVVSGSSVREEEDIEGSVVGEASVTGSVVVVVVDFVVDLVVVRVEEVLEADDFEVVVDVLCVEDVFDVLADVFAVEVG